MQKQSTDGWGLPVRLSMMLKLDPGDNPSLALKAKMRLRRRRTSPTKCWKIAKTSRESVEIAKTIEMTVKELWGWSKVWKKKEESCKIRYCLCKLIIENSLLLAKFSFATGMN